MSYSSEMAKAHDLLAHLVGSLTCYENATRHKAAGVLMGGEIVSLLSRYYTNDFIFKKEDGAVIASIFGYDVYPTNCDILAVVGEVVCEAECHPVVREAPTVCFRCNVCGERIHHSAQTRCCKCRRKINWLEVSNAS